MVTGGAATKREALTIPVAKFRRLFDYLDEQGIDGTDVAAAVGVDHRAIMTGASSERLHGLYYARLYNETVRRLQGNDLMLPWGAGIGGLTFRLMAFGCISCTTLGEALMRAADFEGIVSPQVKGDRMSLERHGKSVRLVYQYRLLDTQHRFVPRAMRGTVWPLVVGRGSGLTVWHAFCGWLTGRAFELSAAGIGAPVSAERYREKLTRQFGCPVAAVDGNSYLEFPVDALERRLVHDVASLEDMLRNAPYQLMQMDQQPSSTSAAIRSLLGNRFADGLPGFEEIAARLEMSPSSLRRRLMDERTSYQRLKDECRCAAAIQLLEGSDLSITVIAERLGFTETSSFIRSFRSWTGATPRSFRDRHLRASAARAQTPV